MSWRIKGDRNRRRRIRAARDDDVMRSIMDINVRHFLANIPDGRKLVELTDGDFERAVGVVWAWMNAGLFKFLFDPKQERVIGWTLPDPPEPPLRLFDPPSRSVH